MHAASAALSKEILEKQRAHNYESEYDRLRAHFENCALYQTRAGVKARASKLEEIGAKATQGDS